MRRLEDEISRSRRYNIPLAVAIIDLDEFKAINDTYGHPAGDVVLRKVAQKMKSLIRNTDSVARWGGEEFMLLASGTNAANALNLAEKIRKEINSLPFEEIEGITISIGVSEYIPGESFQQWFKRTDSALYKAKESGRNCVVVC